jgi:hypothetical protein
MHPFGSLEAGVVETQPLRQRLQVGVDRGGDVLLECLLQEDRRVCVP